jgi:hypothetical protein
VNRRPAFLGFLGSAIRRGDSVHPQVFHQLAVVIKGMSYRIHGERKASFLPTNRGGHWLGHIFCRQSSQQACEAPRKNP